MRLNDYRHVYFIGIGGIGMSAVARYCHRRGLKVTGYDRTTTQLTGELEAEGIQVHYEARPNAIPPAAETLAVYTPAIPVDFAELRHVRKGDYTVMKRSEILGLITKDFRSVAIAGTHGKTTTTTLTTYLMTAAGLEPSAFLGGIAEDFNGNYVEGSGEFVVVEADEYDRSFLRLDPDIAVILSTDPDHLDIYGDHDTMMETGFRAFVRRIQPGGQLIVRYDLADQFPDLDHVIRTTFGIGSGDFHAYNIRVEDGAFYFDLREPDGHLITDLRTALPGRHNIENAVAACAVTRLAGGSEDGIREGLATFHGIRRRFATRLKTDELVIIDDYAHHPTELEAAISAAKELYPNRRVTGVFQPHLFSRTRDFADGFARALDGLDEAILIPIYPAREEPIPGITSKTIYERMRNPNRRLLDDEAMLEALAQLTEDVVLFLGAGDIEVLVNRYVATHQNTPTHG